MSDDLGLAGKTALVTGSGRNIGRAILLELASHGANVIVNARSDKAEADAVAKEAEGLGARSLVVMGEAADKATVERMRTSAEETFAAHGLLAPGQSVCPACAIAASLWPRGWASTASPSTTSLPASLTPSATWIPTPR